MAGGRLPSQGGRRMWRALFKPGARRRESTASPMTMVPTRKLAHCLPSPRMLL
jgi:hypothetical protein